eukprot:bmy_11293T0
MATIPPRALGSSYISQFLLLTFYLPVLGGMEEGCPPGGPPRPQTSAHPKFGHSPRPHTQHKQRASFCPPAAFTANAVLTPTTPPLPLGAHMFFGPGSHGGRGPSWGPRRQICIIQGQPIKEEYNGAPLEGRILKQGIKKTHNLLLITSGDVQLRRLQRPIPGWLWKAPPRRRLLSRNHPGRRWNLRATSSSGGCSAPFLVGFGKLRPPGASSPGTTPGGEDYFGTFHARLRLAPRPAPFRSSLESSALRCGLPGTKNRPRPTRDLLLPGAASATLRRATRRPCCLCLFGNIPPTNNPPPSRRRSDLGLLQDPGDHGRVSPSAVEQHPRVALSSGTRGMAGFVGCSRDPPDLC